MPRYYEDYDLYEHHSQPYMHYGPFEVITFFMFCVIGLAIISSLACALSCLTELADEFPSSARKILRTLVFCVLAVHVLILVMEQFSFWRSLVSIVTNILYLRILAGFPHASPVQPLTLLTVVFLVLETLSWLTLFTLSPDFRGVVGVSRVVSFITLLWLVPIGLIVSLEVEAVKLPGRDFAPSPPSSAMSSGSGERSVVYKWLKRWFPASSK